MIIIIIWTDGKHASLRSHIRPRLSVFLSQHKRHEVDFAEGPSAHDTVVAMSIFFLIVRAKSKKRKCHKLG